MIVDKLILGIGMPGLPEMMVVMFLILLLFGGSKLPSLMRNLGKSANEFKRGMNETGDGDDPAGRGDETA